MTIADIREAAAAIAGAVAQTPTVAAPVLSELVGAEIYLKLETLHRTGSFKERGALNKLLTLSPEQRRAGVVAMSAGNHAQGVAYHAQRLGRPGDDRHARGHAVYQDRPYRGLWRHRHAQRR